MPSHSVSLQNVILWRTIRIRRIYHNLKSWSICYRNVQNRWKRSSSCFHKNLITQRIICEMLQIFQFHMLELFLTGQKVFRCRVQKYGFGTIWTESINSNFKIAINNWQPVNCPYRLCKKYIVNLTLYF